MTVARYIAVVAMVIGLSIMPAFGKSNPTLVSLANGIDSGQGNTTQGSLAILSLRIDIHAHGRLADIVVEAQIANMSDERDEGRFGLTLPANAVITGYALDIDGRMIDGQLLEQPKARNVYEDEIRKGIDPGLAEVTAENRFQTRIFPIERGKPRTIRITFSAPFDPLDGFLLPLETDQPITRMQIDARIEGYKSPPQLLLGGVPLKLLASGSTWTMSQSYKNHRPAGNLSLSGGDPVAKLLISRHRKGMDYFQIGDAAPGMPSANVDRLRIYWDRSLSRRDDLLPKEIDLLTAYVDAAHPSAIDLVTFASDTPTVSHLADSGSLRDTLTTTVYRGGTDMADLDDLKLASADQCILMSDGLLTIGSQAGFRPDCRLTIVTSASGANGTALGRLANASQGQFVRLTESNGSDLLTRLLKPAVAVVAARDDNGRRLAFRALPAATGEWFAVGEMPASGNVHLLIAGLRKGLTERLYSVEGSDQATIDAPAVLWASQQAAELADDPLSHDKMVKLARTYSVASPAMAFLVLERPGQYLQADIRPPAGFSVEWMTDYRDAKKQSDARRSDEKAERLSFVINQWAKRKDWWNKSFVPKPRQKSAPVSHALSPPPPMTVTPPPAPVAAPSSQPLQNAADQTFEDAANIIVTAQRADDRLQALPVSVTAISGKDVAGKTIALDLADILSDQPYLKALDASSPAQRLAVLAEQEKIYGILPAFYLETSEWFRLKGEAATAEALLYSALELPTADDETRQVVAFRLQRAGQIDRAIAMLEKIAVTTDFGHNPNVRSPWH